MPLIPALFLALAMSAPMQVCPADAVLLTDKGTPKLIADAFSQYNLTINAWGKEAKTVGMPVTELVLAIERELPDSNCAEAVLRRELIKMIRQMGGSQEGAEVSWLEYRPGQKLPKAVPATIKVSFHHPENYQNF